MSLNLIKRSRKTLFCSKLDIKPILVKEDYTDVIPYNFAEIDKIVRRNQKIYPVKIGEEHTKDQIMRKFINKVKFMIRNQEDVKASSLKGYEYSPLSQETSKEKWKSDLEMYNKVYKLLPSMSKDNLIKILKFATPAYFYTKSRFWFRMCRVTLRYILAHKENLRTEDIAKILNNLREWKFEQVRDLQSRFDLLIPMNNTWNIEESSQLLLSLDLLNMERSRSFEFLNELTMIKLNVEENLHTEGNFTNIINRLVRIIARGLERYGTCNRMINSLQSYFRRNPVALKCLNPKTLCRLTELVPHWPKEDEVNNRVLSTVSQQFNNLTLEEAIKAVFNVAMMDPNLPEEMEKETIKLFYRFRESYLASKSIMTPENTFKIVYLCTHFLKNPDNELILRCLWDLKANMNQAGLVPITGNILCFKYLLNQFSERLNQTVKEGVEGTLKEMADMTKSSQKMAFESEHQHVNFTKMWTIPLLHEFILTSDILDQFREFYEGMDKVDIRAAMRTFLLFLSSTFGRRELMEANFKNLVILTCSKLCSKLQGGNDGNILKELEASEYWRIIGCYLSCLRMGGVFEREVGLKQGFRTEDVTVNLVSILKMVLEGRELDEMKGCLKVLAKEGRRPENAENIIIRFMVMNNLKEVERAEMAKDFYAPKINVVKFKKNEEGIERYVNKCLSTSCKPIRMDLMWARLFFRRSNPKNLVELVPSIVVGEMLTVKRSKNELYGIGNWLKLEKKWRSLWKYVRNKKEGKKEPKKEKGEEPKLVYLNGRLREMEISYVLEDFYVGPWKCPYVAKNIERNQTLLIFPIYSDLNKEEHIFDEMRRKVLKNLGYNFIELHYQLPHKQPVQYS